MIATPTKGNNIAVNTASIRRGGGVSCAQCDRKAIHKKRLCGECGVKLGKARHMRVGGGLFFIGIASIVASFSFLAAQTQNFSSAESTEIDKKSIAAAVVSIYCENGEGEGSGGSGTIVSENGLVLTNAHVIPETVNGKRPKCVIALPDTRTGSSKEFYRSYPIEVDGLSDRYDLAFMQIYDAVSVNGVKRGTYPRTFPAHTVTEACEGKRVSLGDPILVYGYPAINGGYALTITDGVVSSFMRKKEGMEGMIVTSAKISFGNSGGLAVDQDGCMVGVPTMVIKDRNESFGIIISYDLITEFISTAWTREKARVGRSEIPPLRRVDR